MKTRYLFLMLSLSLVDLAAGQAPPPVSYAPAPAVAAPPTATPAPPPAAPPKLSAADLEKLVAPIALYPDPLIATILPASVYPLDIVQAARFVKDTNNLAKIDAQPWDENVKAVARVPAAIQKLNDDLPWTISLGEAFLAQDQDLMDAIQTLRAKAQKAGTLQTTPQQIVVVTNTVVERTIEQRVVVVTNTIVEIQPANPQIIYVPQYNPVVVYAPPPAYVYNPLAPLLIFGAGVAVGAIIANNNHCDWHHGGVYYGGHGNVNVNVNNNYNRNVNNNFNQNVNNNFNQNVNNSRNTAVNTGGGKWQPDQNRMRTSGSAGSSASVATREARGWDSGGARPSTGNTATRPSAGTQPARPSAGTQPARPSAGTQPARPSTGTAPAARPTASQTPSRPASSPSAAQSRTSPSARGSSGSSAFGGVNSGSSARNYSSRGTASRGGGGGGGGRGGGGGGRR